MNKYTSIGVIGIVCPASGDTNETIDLYINKFKNLGFNIKEGKYIRKKNNYLSGNDKERAEDINEMFRDNNVKAIVCFRGGYGSIRMAKYLDLKAIKNNPKPFFGYSDITLLLNYLNKSAGLITYHAPMIKSNFENEETLQSLLKFLTNQNNRNTIEINLNKFTNIKSYSTKKISGKISGGNLSIICSSLKTPYEIDTDNKILLIEEVNEEPYSIDRLLSQLIYSGKLKKVKGILIGHITPKSTLLDNIIKDILLPLNIPLMTGIPIGHDYPNITLPIGQKCYIDFKDKKILI
ncbi:S66 peptidase family protein [Clostridium mediterraneense]|uniref:S66 peptidase family protein n=1 Tax=Clostridium mediterraneense TaxID=1805472 RepID=UPI000831885C|nr:LD-carboxypeptidase [Clostridium mediterraneense]